ncbi:MAG: stage IV sporulation protein A [Clostridiales bacterium]|nr:stage IV sporulation protein A [Clostridiales bacterium]
MDRESLYRDIATRTQGDIYLGVVGPVRTGKSTFIKRFSELLMLPNIENEHIRARVVDELPQSGKGRTVMTTQPKFVPSDAVQVSLAENIPVNMRLVDCVGYMIPDAIGSMEGEVPRLVRTPWFDYDIPFEEAAALGTEKVICDHSTIGIVMTTDGSITDISREKYLEAETRAITAAKATGKPFVVIVNSTMPEGDAAQGVVETLTATHGVHVLPLDVLRMNERSLQDLLTQILFAFPLKLIQVQIPPFMRALGTEHPLVQRLLLPVLSTAPALRIMSDYTALVTQLSSVEQFECPTLEELSLGTGTVTVRLRPEDGVFYEVLSNACDCDIRDDYQLMSTIKDFVSAKREFDLIAGALAQAKQTGYGIVPPILDEMELLDPEIIRQGSKFGVKLHAKASGLHLIRVDIDSEINPIVGSEQQSEALVQYLTDTFSSDPTAIWQTNIFGKSLYELVCEGMQGKVVGMNEMVQQRMQNTLQRIVNDGCNGLICIML